MKSIKNRITKEKAFEKIKYYCAYQERSHFEVRKKLYDFGLFKTEVENILTQLIEDDYLNEERFAVQFAGGKFRMKHWGRKKIEQHLKLKQVSAYNIRKALKEIDEEEYLKILKKLATEKWNKLKHEQYLNRTAKTLNYLLQKGYEAQLAHDAVKSIREGSKNNHSSNN